MEPSLERPKPQSILAIMEEMNRQVLGAEFDTLLPTPTGFDPMDRYLGGGVRPGELVVISGAQGVGKTTMAFQIARNIAAARCGYCLFLCYEHDSGYLLSRLISLESLDPHYGDGDRGLRQIDFQKAILTSRSQERIGLHGILLKDWRASAVVQKIRAYGERLRLLKGSGTNTDLPAIADLVRDAKASGLLPLTLFVDYLQKIALYPEPAGENEKITRVTEGLKELALAEGIPIVAISAAEKEGLQAKRLRLHHVRGSSALAYESDIILVLNDKYHIVSKSSIEHNPYKAQGYKDWVVCSIEKNRSGIDGVDLQFRKRFEFCCFDPNGDLVTDKLIDDRLYAE